MPKPWETLATAPGATPSARPLALVRRGDDVVLRAGNALLMSSREHASEDALGALAAQAPPGGHVVIGGLGFGYTLRAALDHLPTGARLTVVELSAALIAWNRDLVGHLARHPLADPRAAVVEGDVVAWIAAARDVDALLLDIDNGPVALSAADNGSLYAPAGIEACARALRPGGVLAVWSEGDDPGYISRLRRAGLQVRLERPPAHSGRSGGGRRVLFIAQRPEVRP